MPVETAQLVGRPAGQGDFGRTPVDPVLLREIRRIIYARAALHAAASGAVIVVKLSIELGSQILREREELARSLEIDAAAARLNAAVSMPPVWQRDP